MHVKAQPAKGPLAGGFPIGQTLPTYRDNDAQGRAIDYLPRVIEAPVNGMGGSGPKSKSRLMLDAFFYEARSKNLSPLTLRCYYQRLMYLWAYAQTLGKELDQLTNIEIRQYFQKLSDSLAVSTINGRLRVFRVFYNFCCLNNIMRENPTYRIPFRKEPKYVRRVISPLEFNQILELVPPDNFTQARNHCMLLLMWDCMLRLNETLSLTLDDWQIDPQRAIRIMGKGRKQRVLPYSEYVGSALKEYFKKYRRDIPGDYLLPTQNGGKIDGHNAWQYITRFGKKIGLHVHPHLLRHSAATHYYQLTRDIGLVSKLLGHADLKTTEIYLHLNQFALVKAYETKSPLTGVMNGGFYYGDN